jgi:Phage integrase, N-terminal SAM-like domain
LGDACLLGTDPLSGRKWYATRTVRGSRTEAQRELLIFAAVASVAPIVGARSTVADLLERWFVAASPNWAPTTVRSVRPSISCQLVPGLGPIQVRELTTVDIDEFYDRLRSDGRHDGKALSVGAVRRVHSVLHRVLVDRQRQLRSCETTRVSRRQFRVLLRVRRSATLETKLGEEDVHQYTYRCGARAFSFA